MKCLLELEKTDLTWAEKLAYLTFRFLDEEQTECPITHRFDHGLYIREMFIPQGTLFIGRPHKIGHHCGLITGRILLITQENKTHLAAPFSIHTTPGYQMVFYAKTDVVGRTYHPDDGERDLDILETRYFEPVEKLKELGFEVHQQLEAPCLA